MSQPEQSETSEISIKITTPESTPAALVGSLARQVEKSLVQHWLKSTNKGPELVEVQDSRAISAIGQALGIRMTVTMQGGQSSLEMTLPLNNPIQAPTKPSK